MERRWKVLIVVSVAVLMASLDLFIVNFAFPSIRREFPGTSVAVVSWVLNAYAIVFAALLVPAGRLADLAGRRRAFLGGVLLFVVGSALCGAAPSVAALIGARVVQAAGAALLTPSALALLLVEFPPRERAVAIGIYAGVGAAAAAAGPPLGGLLVQVSWRMVFLVNLPIGLAALAFAVRLLRESRDPAVGRPDLLGTALLILAIGLLALGLVAAPDWGWGSAPTLAVLGAALAGLGAFWARCLRHPDPVVDPSMLRVRSFAMAASAQVLFSTAFAAMLLGNVLFLTGVWKYSALTAGLSLWPGPLMAATFAPIAGRLAGRVGQRTLAVVGIGIFGLAGVWWWWRLGPTPDYLAAFLPGQLVGGMGVGLTLPSLMSAAAASLPAPRFGTGSAVLNMSRQIGFVLGVAILVAVLGTLRAADPIRAFDGGWLFMVVAAGLGVLAAFAIGEVRRPAAAEPASAEAAPAEART
ncbi:MAG TPA: MFS transporter [Candidatus Dormibacteraeota bacterium]